jgi:hypothetical protein
LQSIDDVVACGPPDGKLIDKFDKAYIGVAEKLGVVLSSRDDPEKSFASTRCIRYDSESEECEQWKDMWENYQHHGFINS